MAQVQVIAPYAPQSNKLSVAAYCRVSSNSEDQLNSYRAQVGYYTRLISENPDWQLADIYADEGITGTSMEKRNEFNRMIADCRSGSIDRILVKSVSRFARNTTELMETTRELQELGVVVIFEEQEIDTSQMHSEMQLALHAMAAQEESRSISQNMLWSYQKRMESGTFIGCSAPYGYRLSKGTLIIIPEEEKILLLIFELYLSGMGQRSITKILNDNHIPYRKGKPWTRSGIRYIIYNERYSGDSLLQKKYTVDSLSHKQKLNRGEVPQYFVENSHPAILNRPTYQNVRQYSSRWKKREITPHLLVHRIQCPDCGNHFREIHSNGKSYWICPNRANGTHDCHLYRFSEESIKTAFLNLVGKLYTYQEELLDPPLKLLREIATNGQGEDRKLMELNEQIAVLNDKAASLQKLNSKGFIDAEEYRRQNEILAAQRRKLSQERKKKLQGNRALEMLEAIELLQNQLDSWQEIPIEFSIELFDCIVEKITPTAKNRLKFKLHCGLEFAEVII